MDRWNRKLVMMLSDLASGLATVVVLILLTSNRLEIWHLYVTGAFSGAFNAFHFPAYSAAVTLMLSKKQYTRASGMLSLASSASGIIAPIAAGMMLTFIGITGIMVFDVFTFLVAIGALLVIHIPQPVSTEMEEKGERSLWKDSVYGFRYIFKRRSILGLQLIFLINNFLGSLGFVLLAPMILSRTGNDSLILGSVQSAFGVGGVVGGLVVSAWGGPKRRIHGLLLGLTSSGLMGITLMGLGRGLTIWALAAFIIMFVNPITNGSSQAIWQSKVAPQVQGRVFATRALIARFSQPLAMVLAGPLADWILEPSMMPGGDLAPVFGWLVGTGPGSGIAIIFVIAGLLGAIFSLGGYVFNAVRNVEDILPDHDADRT